MKCNNCGVNIDYSTSKCPICGAPIAASGLPMVYPAYEPVARKKYLPYERIFFVVTLVIVAVMAIINAATFKSVMWALPACFALVSVYIAVFVAFNGKYSTAFRSVTAFLVIIATAYAFGECFGFVENVTYSIVPNVFTLFTMVMAIYLIIIDRELYCIPTLGFALLGFIPIIIYLCRVEISLTLCIISAAVSAVAVIVALTLNAKRLNHIFTAFFHF